MKNVLRKIREVLGIESKKEKQEKQEKLKEKLQFAMSQTVDRDI